MIEPENVSITNSVRDTVSMKFAPEDGRRRAHLFTIFVLNRGSGETEKDRAREGRFDRREHIAEGRAMTFVDDKDETLSTYFFKVGGL